MVEVDETYIGGEEKNKHASQKPKKLRWTAGKQAILGMRERGGQTQAKLIPGADRQTLWNEIEQNIEKGSTLYADDHGAYRGLELTQYNHQPVNHSAKQYVDGMAHANGVESVWAVLKRGYYGTYHNWSLKHMRRYVNECTFRLNDGDVQRDMVNRIASLSQALLCGKRLRYQELVA